jgi:hypothetical protein
MRAIVLVPGNVVLAPVAHARAKAGGLAGSLLILPNLGSNYFFHVFDLPTMRLSQDKLSDKALKPNVAGVLVEAGGFANHFAQCLLDLSIPTYRLPGARGLLPEGVFVTITEDGELTVKEPK